jgi:hypothetical protein
MNESGTFNQQPSSVYHIGGSFVPGSNRSPLTFFFSRSRF